MPVLVSSTNVHIEYDEGAFVEAYVDEWGTTDVYKITRFLIQNLSVFPYLFSSFDVNGDIVQAVLQGGETLSKNLPTPQRINSYPLTVSYSRVTN